MVRPRHPTSRQPAARADRDRLGAPVPRARTGRAYGGPDQSHGETQRSRPIAGTEYEPDLTFAVTAHDSPTGPVLECSGELDLDVAPLLRTALGEAFATRPAHLVLDLNGVTFMDSTGLDVLIRAHLEAARTGTALRLARPSQSVTRILKLTGTDQVLLTDLDLSAARPAG
ncbi:STAS domain-containing protein [Kitasatospora sp. NPDC101801]|uniref:STAS domain-containing protein n=1 Tax=Kitasatospora sp. NPDC101801 TaxID=3364103 RepID=UPI003828424B